MRRRVLAAGFSFALAVSVCVTSPFALAQTEILNSEYKGITLIAVPPDHGMKFNVLIFNSHNGIKKIRSALDVIFRESPFNVAKIEALKQDGRVAIFYDPNYPNPRNVNVAVQVARFLPLYDERGNKSKRRGKDYLAVVSRHGIKWPVRELAAVLVHELVGHGTQHLHDRFEGMRPTEIECEAWLYEEQAYQDFRFDKSSREMVEFRQELEGVGFSDGYCSDFKRYLQKHKPSQMSLWESINPDVPGLLMDLEDFLKRQRAKGVTSTVAPQQGPKKDTFVEDLIKRLR